MWVETYREEGGKGILINLNRVRMIEYYCPEPGNPVVHYSVFVAYTDNQEDDFPIAEYLETQEKAQSVIDNIREAMNRGFPECLRLRDVVKEL